MLDNVKVRTKLIGGFMVVALIGLAVGLIGIFNIKAIDDKDTFLYEKATVPLGYVNTINGNFQRIRNNISKSVAQLSQHDSNAARISIEKIAKHKEKINTSMLAYSKTLLSADDSVLYKTINELLIHAYKDVDEIGYLIENNKLAESHKYLKSNEFNSTIDSLNLRIDEMAEINVAAAKEISDSNTNAANTATTYMILVIILSTIVSIILGFLLSQGITKPLSEVVTLMKELESGNLTSTLNLQRKDELGILAKAIDNFAIKLKKIMRDIKESSEGLAGSSEELAAVSTQLVAASEEMTVQSNTVSATTEQMSTNINTMASAAEEMSVNTNTVASASEQMATNMNAVSSAVEEMSISIGDISKSAEQAQFVAQDATSKAKAATNTMDQLGKAAKEIGKVTDVIKRIAEQTNLLALNATIEAASAGEAGKGFAVVANEIKELASQSAQAAGDIAEKIEGVQANTGDAVRVISDVAVVIDKIGVSVQTISAAVEQQTKASNDIANNVGQASSGVRNMSKSISEVAKGAIDVARNSGEAAKGAKDVTRNIVGVSQASKQANNGAQQVDIASKELSKMAGSLKEMVDQFKI